MGPEGGQLRKGDLVFKKGPGFRVFAVRSISVYRKPRTTQTGNNKVRELLNVALPFSFPALEMCVCVL